MLEWGGDVCKSDFFPLTHKKAKNRDSQRVSSAQLRGYECRTSHKQSPECRIQMMDAHSWNLCTPIAALQSSEV